MMVGGVPEAVKEARRCGNSCGDEEEDEEDSLHWGALKLCQSSWKGGYSHVSWLDPVPRLSF